MRKDSNDSVARQPNLSTLIMTPPMRPAGKEIRSQEGTEKRKPVRAPKRRKGSGSGPPATTQSLFPRLVLGWINADFRVQIRILQHFSSSSRKSSSREQICNILTKNHGILQKFWEFFFKFSEKMHNFEKRIPLKKGGGNTKFLQNFYKILTKSCKIL